MAGAFVCVISNRKHNLLETIFSHETTEGDVQRVGVRQLSSSDIIIRQSVCSDSLIKVRLSLSLSVLLTSRNYFALVNTVGKRDLRSTQVEFPTWKSWMMMMMTNGLLLSAASRGRKNVQAFHSRRGGFFDIISTALIRATPVRGGIFQYRIDRMHDRWS